MPICGGNYYNLNEELSERFITPYRLMPSLLRLVGALPISASRWKKLTDSGLESSQELRCISVVVLVKSFADTWEKLNLVIRYFRFTAPNAYRHVSWRPCRVG